MKRFLVLLVTLALGLAYCHPALTCLRPQVQKKCCACDHKSPSLSSCCCGTQPSSDTSRLLERTSVDTYLTQQQSSPAPLVTLEAGARIAHREPGDEYPVLPPLFLLDNAFLS